MQTDENGIKSWGECKKGTSMKTGRHIVLKPKDHIYEGYFKDGKRHGQAIMTFYDGRTHMGEWAEDKRSGPGVFSWPDG